MREFQVRENNDMYLTINYRLKYFNTHERKLKMKLTQKIDNTLHNFYKCGFWSFILC